MAAAVAGALPALGGGSPASGSRAASRGGRSEAEGLGASEPLKSSLDAWMEKEEWVARLWQKLDIDRSGTVSRDELDCETFHEVIRGAVNPDKAASGGASHARAELNMRDAINFCMRKADQNADRSLSYEEFRSLLFCLSDQEANRADLAFVLFDLDNSGQIDAPEFRGLCRFFLGRAATQDEFMKEWKWATKGNDLNIDQMDQVVTRRQYCRWLQTTPTATFNRYAPPKEAPGSGGEMFRQTAASAKPRWNNRINTGPNPGHVNDALPLGRRRYFGAPQSMTQLKEFYDSFEHTGVFRKHRRDLERKAPPRATPALLPKCLSSEGGTPLTLPGRHAPGGTMHDHKTGRPAIWEDNFVAPLRLRKHGAPPGERPLPPRAIFGESTSEWAAHSGGSSWAARSGRSSSTGALRSSSSRQRNPDNIYDIRPRRATTMEAIPW